ncbi:MAG: peptidoglycan-binding protein [Oscillospiraceae bacterium]|nr:peptidoglycan-binding protein [Oscillospiraceae bacterium]MBR5723578.1 peptidoglycan-binding protein [Oscillospiraceae bacterium]
MLYTEAQKQEHIEEILGMLYQVALRDSRIPIVLPQKEYSEEAALAVRAFQEAYGLPVTGEIDEQTWNQITEAYRRLTAEAIPLRVFPSGSFLLRRGDSGVQVLLLQSLLNLAAERYANIAHVGMSGVFDEETEAAVRSLQQLAGLPETGELDLAAWNRLAMLFNSLTV